MDPLIALAVFPVVFIGELPDKTMFASLVLATRGRPIMVWLGAATAFAVHVAIATTVGVALFAVLPRRVIDVGVAVLFLVGAAFAYRQSLAEDEAVVDAAPSGHGVALTAFLVVFVAEWGDLTQILTANLAARYHSAPSVALGATLALWAVAAIAVTSGQTLLRFIAVKTIRRITVVVLVGLAVATLVSAFT